MRSMSEWDDLRFVLGAARAGGLAAAARALGVNHATVSRRVAAAESRLGARLFDRTAGGLVPTASGRDAIAAAEVMEDAALALSRVAAGRDAAPAGPVRLTVPAVLMGPALCAALAGFRARHPGVALTVLAGNDLANLHRREADVALRVSSAPDPALWGVKLSPQNRAAYAAPRWAEAAWDGAPVDWLGFTHWENPAAGSTRVALAAAGFDPARVAFRFDDMAAMVEAARCGLGAAVMPCFLGEGDLGLMRLPPAPTPYHDIWALTHPDLARAERVRLLIGFLQGAVRPLRPMFLGAKTGA
jgi:DNA-binding transcriptional LysR family regulator